MKDLSLHILDIVENATAAGARLVEISLKEDASCGELILTVKDNGRGMDLEFLESVTHPFSTTRTERRVGLGLALLDEAARQAGGRLEIESEPGRGTCVRARFQLHHIDRKPIGDMGATIAACIMGNPDVDFIVDINISRDTVHLDTRELRAILDGVSITHPDVIAYVKGLFKKYN